MYWYSIGICNMPKCTPQYHLPCGTVISQVPPCFGSFAQWQYHSQWGLSEAWLLLVENYTQYPALRTWNMVLCAIFDCSYGSKNERTIYLIHFLRFLATVADDLFTLTAKVMFTIQILLYIFHCLTNYFR